MISESKDLIKSVNNLQIRSMMKKQLPGKLYEEIRSLGKETDIGYEETNNEYIALFAESGKWSAKEYIKTKLICGRYLEKINLLINNYNDILPPNFKFHQRDIDLSEVIDIFNYLTILQGELHDIVRWLTCYYILHPEKEKLNHNSWLETIDK